MSSDEPDVRSLGQWFDTWGARVAGCDFDGARSMFSPDVVGFGTFMDAVEGIDALESRQWRTIWPTIADFRFLTETMRAFVSSDRRLATVMIVWHSRGFDENGESYDRPGRTTAVLARETLDSPWLGLHTHFSEFPDERQRSFGPRN